MSTAAGVSGMSGVLHRGQERGQESARFRLRPGTKPIARVVWPRMNSPDTA